MKYRLPNTSFCIALALLAALVVCSASAQEDISSGGIPVESVVLRLLHEANAPAQQAGVLTSILVREGDRVKQGEVLAELDSREAEIAERAAKVELSIAAEKAANDVQVRFAAKSHEVAVAELRRSEESIKSFAKSVSQSQVDVERLEVEKTALEKEQAEHSQRLGTMEVQLKQTLSDAARLARTQRRIVAPLDGVVVEAAAKLGEWLEPGELAFRLVNAERLKAEGFVTAQDAGRLKPGIKVMLTLPGDGRTFPGRIVFISPEIDPINDQVRLWAEIENAEQLLRPGQRAKMQALVDAAR